MGGWARSGDYYKSVEVVAKKLPPALYSFFATPEGVFFKEVQFPTDNPIKLPGLPSDYILNQIHLFWSRKDRYETFSFLQKRGILMYGPPGCGKTSIIRLLCDELIGQGGIIFRIDSFRSAATCISHFRRIEPHRPVMTLMEDIEGLFRGEGGPAEVQAALSFLDGQAQINNVVHIGTTNEPEGLADRFIKRPGRFDLVIGIHAPKPETREAYLRHVSKDRIPEDKLKELVTKTEGLGLSYLRELASTWLCLDIPLDETLARLQLNFKSRCLSSKETKFGFTIGYNRD